jgi:hypothetical protein
MPRRSPYVTRTKIIRERGWPADLVDQVLGEEAVLGRNPHRPSGPNMRLYRIADVEAAELRPNIRRALRFPPPPQGILSRKAFRAIEADWKELVDALEPKVEVIPLDDLQSVAVSAYVAWMSELEKSPGDLTNEKKLRYLMFCHARRELVDWAAISAALPAPLTISDVKILCRERVNVAVRAAYPALSPAAEADT